MVWDEIIATKSIASRRQIFLNPAPANNIDSIAVVTGDLFSLPALLVKST